MRAPSKAREPQLTGKTNAERAKPSNNVEADKKGIESIIKTYQGIGIPIPEGKGGIPDHSSGQKLTKCTTSTRPDEDR